MAVKRGNMNPSQAINPNQALWEKGDFTEIAAFMRESGEAIGRVGPGSPRRLRALDLGCGDGTTALPWLAWAPKSSGSTLPRTWSKPATSVLRRRGLTA